MGQVSVGVVELMLTGYKLRKEHATGRRQCSLWDAPRVTEFPPVVGSTCLFTSNEEVVTQQHIFSPHDS